MTPLAAPMSAPQILRIGIEPEVARRHEGVHLAAKIASVKVLSEYAFEPALTALRSNMTLSLEDLRSHPVVRAFRDFYWRLGIDPTKTRPASEALARRLITTGSIPRINSVVDAGNLSSVETLVPLGLYNMNKVRGDLHLRFAKENEAFVDISGSERKLGSLEIVLADQLGPVHLFPHRDSLRTMVTLGTSRIAVVGCGVKGMDLGLVSESVDRTLERILQFSG